MTGAMDIGNDWKCPSQWPRPAGASGNDNDWIVCNIDWCQCPSQLQFESVQLALPMSESITAQSLSLAGAWQPPRPGQ